MNPSGRHAMTGALDHTLKKIVHKDQETDLHSGKKHTYKLQVSTRQQEQNGAPHFGIF
jgi:hypothetical protein